MSDGIFGLDTDWQFAYLNGPGRTVVCDAIDESFTAGEYGLL